MALTISLRKLEPQINAFGNSNQSSTDLTSCASLTMHASPTNLTACVARMSIVALIASGIIYLSLIGKDRCNWCSLRLGRTMLMKYSLL